jgi:hypothetical protein
MINRNPTVFLLMSFLLFNACKKEKKETTLPKTSNQLIMVLNEGNFGWGNASVGIYDAQEANYLPNIFENINNRPLGDVLQSAEVIGDEIYLVINNSGYIEVLDYKTFKLKRTLNNLGSPRYMSKIQGLPEAFVSDIYSNSIKRIDLNSGKILVEIPLTGWGEYIGRVNDSTFAICNITSQTLYYINSMDNIVYDSIALEGKLSGFYKTTQGNYILEQRSNKSIVWKVRHNKQLEKIVETDVKIDKFCVNPKTSDIFFLSQNSLFKSIGNTTTFEKISEIKGSKMYAMQFIESLEQIWISDALDYVRKGKVGMYDLMGQLNDEFQSEFITNGFLELF